MGDIKYDHRLNMRQDGMLECTCGQFVGNTEEASTHFLTTTTTAVREQTGWRGWLRRWSRR